MKHIPLALLLALVLQCAPALASEDISKVNGSIRASAGQTYGDLETVNGGVTVEEGVVTREIETVNGSIRVDDRARTTGVSTVNGNVRIGRDVVAAGNVETVNGSIFVDRGSVVEGNMETVNGGIGLVETRLNGTIETVNGDITVGVGSEVQGGIRVKKPNFSLSLTGSRKPRVIIGPNASVSGSLQFDREVTLYVHRSAHIGPVSGARPQAFDTDAAPQD
ncbi:hypothetical protein [Stenotrophomonas rhizophila]|uniref:hypothetical protein n=1 Tax=Stenotrophomonas rhizophila TaxID=216778 RepID=UPI0028B1CBD2|nr:hypothetical protein [Stenotrophomonas rhizophila]